MKQIFGKGFYNYLLIDGDKFFKIMEKYQGSNQEISNADFEKLKKCIFYAGKGQTIRKFNHLVAGKKLLKNKLKFSKICAKFSKITRIWEKGLGVICLQLFHETNHFMAHCREFAMIKALGLNNLTNDINGHAYGAMKNSWNHAEIVNFGDLILYNAFKMCLMERPSLIYQEDIILRIKKCTKTENWELLGILECFLEL